MCNEEISIPDMSFNEASILVQRQLDYLAGGTDILRYNTNNPVTDVHSLSQWSEIKLYIFIWLAGGSKGIRAQYGAIKLLTLYELWADTHSAKKLARFRELLQEEIQRTWKLHDERLLRNQLEERRCSVSPQSPRPDQSGTAIDMPAPTIYEV